MPTAAPRLSAALLLLVALTAAALGPGQSFADYFDDDSSSDYDYSDAGGSGGSGGAGGGSGPVALAAYDAQLVSSDAVGLDLREAYAYVTPARGGRLRVRVRLLAAARGHARTATVVAAPCTSFDAESEELRCRGGARDPLEIAAGAPRRVTGEVVIPAPRRAIDAIAVKVLVGASAQPVALTIPGPAWRGRLAGRAVGGKLADGGGLHAELAALRLSTYANAKPAVAGSVRLINAGAKDKARAETTVRRCAPLVPACRVDSRTVDVLGDSQETADPGSDALAKPKGASPVLRLAAVARPSSAILAELTLPWPEHVSR